MISALQLPWPHYIHSAEIQTSYSDSLFRRWRKRVFLKFASHGWLHIFLPLIAKGRYMPEQHFCPPELLPPSKAAPGKQVLCWIIPPAHFRSPSLWAGIEKSPLASLKQISDKLLLLLLSNFQHFILVNSAGDHSPQEGTGTWGSEDESFSSADKMYIFNSLRSPSNSSKNNRLFRMLV